MYGADENGELMLTEQVYTVSNCILAVENFD